MTAEQTWRGAVAVDLYDARTFITTSGELAFGDVMHPGGSINGAELARLAAYFGVQPQSIPGAAPLAEVTFETWQGLQDYSAGSLCAVQTIEARILAPGLLELRVTLADRQDATDTYVEHFTYAGRFAVQWDDALADS